MWGARGVSVCVDVFAWVRRSAARRVLVGGWVVETADASSKLCVPASHARICCSSSRSMHGWSWLRFRGAFGAWRWCLVFVLGGLCTEAGRAAPCRSVC